MLKSINMDSKWTAEIEYINDLLEADVRNNSAWNQRWLVTHRGSKSKPLPVETASDEVNFVISKAQEDPYNESPWRYFIALIKEQFRLIASSPEFISLIDTCENSLKEVKESFELESKKDGMECTHLIAAHIDILEMKGDEDSLSSAVEFAHLLESRYDPVRQKYWKLRAQQLVVAK
jgi:protein farnesyltransferase/geranylgeranyltransferase type-1 subunit alpha